MIKKHVLTVKQDTLQVEALPAGESQWEYRVGRGVKLSLVLTSVKNHTSDARVSVRLVGQGASATITGVIIAHKDTKFALHTMQIHEAAGTTSDLLIKTVLSDHAKCTYDGGIRVEKAAQKTDAYQRNENLLLSGRAYVESKPSLEILANDVRCTHGATAGSIDPEELWYLSTRGIAKKNAEKLIVNGFINSALERIDDIKVRTVLQQKYTFGV